MWWILLGTLFACYIYFKVIKPYNYWKEKGIVSSKPWPLLGNMAPTFFKKKSYFDVLKDLYSEFPDQRYMGVFQFTKPILLIRDVDLIKQLTIKDFEYFTDHNTFVTEEADPFVSRALFSLSGQKWREMRATLSPAFTSNKMRVMFTLIANCAESFTKHHENLGAGITTLELKDVFTKFANDVIASVAFGVNCDSLNNSNDEFYRMEQDATTFGGHRALKFIGFGILPTLMKLMKVTLIPKHVGDFFFQLITQTMSVREEQKITRPDMIHLLMEAKRGRLKHEEQDAKREEGFAAVDESEIGKDDKNTKKQISDLDITAQALIFFFAGFDTASTVLSFMAHELAVDPDVQEKLQREIDETLEECDGKITYEALLGMKYMDMVVSETLRKWPPGFQLDRKCVKNYTIQPTKPEEKPLTIEKDSTILIPLSGIHHDPKYFPNPQKFDPERFSDENRAKITPGTYFPFGSGPRNCIGSRFALLEVKTLFTCLLAKFDITVVEKTQIPLQVSKNKFNLQVDGGFWLGLRQRKCKTY